MNTFKALQVSEESGEYISRIVERQEEELPEGDVLIRVEYSSLNYKDALSASGNKGVTRHYPHTPGIDAAGEVLQCSSGAFSPGDKVIVTGYDLGMNTDGGYGQRIRVPAEWVVPLPQGLTTETAMHYGTAGLTAALCVDSLEQVGITPSFGPVLVTGATGGVAIISIAILARAGFEVVACTGKTEKAEWLQAMGATSVIGRDELLSGKGKPMQKPRWGGVVDTVGGEVLSTALSALQYGGSAACCGMAGGATFTSSIFPFILRGINLLGVDSVELPLDIKQAMWQEMAGRWQVDLSPVVERVTLEELPGRFSEILAGRHVGRTVVKVS